MSIRTYTNSRRNDISPQLQSILNGNGMQAHIDLTENGDYYLTTLAHNSTIPRRYKLTDSQVAVLSDIGSELTTKKAYNLFTSIVGNDYYMPSSFYAAHNVNSPVNMGQNYKVLNAGEYNYLGHPTFRSFDSPRFGRFSTFHQGLWSCIFGLPNVRRVGDHPYYSTMDPIVVDRPDGRLKPGEFKTGDYGFYDKGNRRSDPVSNLEVKSKPMELVRPKGQSIPISAMKGTPNKDAVDKFWKILASHGLSIQDYSGTDARYKGRKEFVVMADGVNRNYAYLLSDEDYKKLTSPFVTEKKDRKGKVHPIKGLSVDDRLDILNKYISGEFSSKITREGLETKDYIKLQLTPEAQAKLDAANAQATKYNSQLKAAGVDKPRTDYHTGFIDRWNSIGVVDGRLLSPDLGFYVPVKDGRRVEVGEIQAYPVSDNGRNTFRMTATINGLIYSHEITKDDYLKFINYDDEYRLRLFDEKFNEVSIKSASHGNMQDPERAVNFDQGYNVVKLEGNYSLVNGDNHYAFITSAMAWKDEVSGNYYINLRDSKDVGMFSWKITQEQFNDFRNATDEQRAQMLTTLIPLNVQTPVNLDTIEMLRPEGQSIPLAFSNSTTDKKETEYKGEDFVKMLASHGLIIDRSKGTLTVQSKSYGADRTYQLSAGDLALLTKDFQAKDVNDTDISKRLDILNRHIRKEFSNEITSTMLQSRDYVNLLMKPDVRSRLSVEESSRVRPTYLKVMKTSEIPVSIANSALAQNDNISYDSIVGIINDKNLSEKIRKEARDFIGSIPEILRNSGDKDMQRLAAKMVSEHLQTPPAMTPAEKVKFNEVIEKYAREHPFNRDIAAALNKKDSHQFSALNAKQNRMTGNTGVLDTSSHSLTQAELENLRRQAKIALQGDKVINGTEINDANVVKKQNKEWHRSGDHGRATEIGDIAIAKDRDLNGNYAKGKYVMTAVIDGQPISHEITQKQYDKFIKVSDYARMKLFDQIFPEVQMQTKPGMGNNLGAKILAALTVGVDFALSASVSRPRPEIYGSMNVFSQPSVPGSYEAVVGAVYEQKARDAGLDRVPDEGIGIGR